MENQSEFDHWMSDLYSEIEVFVARVNDLDLSESVDRRKLFSLIDRFSTRFTELRQRSEASSASTDALIKLEKLIERMNNTSEPVAVSVAYLGESPREKAKREAREKKEEKNRIRRLRNERDEIAEHIQQVIEALDPEGE